MAIEIQPASIAHCPFYCEENVWHLARRSELAGYDVRVVFISNHERLVHFNAQEACGREMFMCWDYHVILMARDETWRVFDLDSLLVFGGDARGYTMMTFPFGDGIAEAPMFRVLNAGEYVNTLSSDRRHMIGSDGKYLRKPPKWPLIQADPDREFNLWDFVSMDEGGSGEVMELEEFEQRFCS